MSASSGSMSSQTLPPLGVLGGIVACSFLLFFLASSGWLGDLFLLVEAVLVTRSSWPRASSWSRRTRSHSSRVLKRRREEKVQEGGRKAAVPP